MRDLKIDIAHLILGVIIIVLAFIIFNKEGGGKYYEQDINKLDSIINTKTRTIDSLERSVVFLNDGLARQILITDSISNEYDLASKKTDSLMVIRKKEIVKLNRLKRDLNKPIPTGNISNSELIKKIFNQ